MSLCPILSKGESLANFFLRVEFDGIELFLRLRRCMFLGSVSDDRKRLGKIFFRGRSEVRSRGRLEGRFVRCTLMWSFTTVTCGRRTVCVVLFTVLIYSDIVSRFILLLAGIDSGVGLELHLPGGRGYSWVCRFKRVSVGCLYVLFYCFDYVVVFPAMGCRLSWDAYWSSDCRRYWDPVWFSSSTGLPLPLSTCIGLFVYDDQPLRQRVGGKAVWTIGFASFGSHSKAVEDLEYLLEGIAGNSSRFLCCYCSCWRSLEVLLVVDRSIGSGTARE